ncbi:SprT family protein [Brevibacillus daliensis]|uniref:SprT family protein n=1 Tax=Brevibacillus daliensis TaxID=2892995 RepID=UPI001E49F82F|nr:SprT family protein [Brevibacillus daliensis]
MNDKELQKMVEEISIRDFNRPFLHQARFNSRLRTTGGRYLLRSHDLEFNPLHVEEHGMQELVGIIKHELCHYHLHLQGRGYAHRDADFINLLKKVGGSRYCQQVSRRRRSLPFRYQLICNDCGLVYRRKKKVDASRYVCGKCRGKLRIVEIPSP